MLIVHEPEQEADDQELDSATQSLLDALLETVSVRDAARIAAKVSGAPRDVLYARALARQASAQGH